MPIHAFFDRLHKKSVPYRPWEGREHLSVFQYTDTVFSPSPMDLNFAPITLGPMGKGPFGGITEKESIDELTIADTFRRFNTRAYALVKDETVYSGLVSRIEATADEYLANGIDPKEEIQISTII